jgi:hypothetical protein
MSNGTYNAYSPNVYGKNWKGAADARVKPNEWTDFAVTVKNRKLTIYSYQESSSDINIYEVSGSAGTHTGTPSGKISLGCSYADGGCGYGYSSAAQRIRAFRGSIQSFASWERALSADEVRQVFAWPGTDLLRLGTVNGSSLDFADGGSASVSASFNVPAQDVGLGQVLRVTTTGGGQMAVDVSVNGVAANAMTLLSGKTELLFLKGDLFHAGANTITLTRTSSTGNIAFDAIALGGGFQIGNQDNSELTDFSDTNQSYLHYYATDGNWKHVMGRIMGINEAHNYRKTRLHVFVPDEVAGHPNYSVRFSFRVCIKDGPSGQPVGVYLNGAETPVLSKAVESGGWREFKCKVSAENLLAGDNVFVLANDYPCNTYTGLFGFDCFRFETVFNPGFVLSVH